MGINPCLFDVLSSSWSLFISLPLMYIVAELGLSCCGFISFIKLISVLFFVLPEEGFQVVVPVFGAYICYFCVVE